MIKNVETIYESQAIKIRYEQDISTKKYFVKGILFMQVHEECESHYIPAMSFNLYHDGNAKALYEALKEVYGEQK